MTDRNEPDRPDEPGRAEDEPAVQPAPEGNEPAARADHGDEPPANEPEPKRGQIRFQDPETTTARAPTLGEQRARRKAIVEQREERERALAETEEAERKSRVRRRIMIGGGVTVGVVALVAVWYAAATPDEVTASCVGVDDQVIQSDENVCDENYVSTHGGYHSGGIFFLPIPGSPGSYRQYQYNYGGSGVPGQRVSGGSTAAPSGNTSVKTNSGKTVQRGGFGVSSGGKSGSGGS